MRHAATALALCLLLPVAAAAEKNAPTVTWEPVGIGGGGGIYAPSISPHDENLIFLACDMGGFYRSTDGGNSWRMCDGAQVRKAYAWPAVFHPTDPDIVLAGAHGGLKRSKDRGLSWENIAGMRMAASPDMPTAVAYNPARPEEVYAGFSTYMGEAGEFLIVSKDGGDTWETLAGWPWRDRRIVKVIFDPRASHGNVIFVATSKGVFESADGGATWTRKSNGLPGEGAVVACAAGWDEDSGRLAVFVTVPGGTADGEFVGGVYRSTDGAQSWQMVNNGLNTEPYDNGKLHEYEFLAMSPANPDVVSVFMLGDEATLEHGCTVYHTTDGGESWKKVLIGKPDWPGCNVELDWLTEEMSWWWGGRATGFSCNPNDPSDVIFTDYGRAIRTLDGGGSWRPISSHRVSGDTWEGRGLEVTTCYEYYFDPHDTERTYIAYTDIGLTRSLDRGRTWIYGAREVPWANTCYELAADPHRPGVFFGVWSNAHDLIHWKMIHMGLENAPWHAGGLARTDDHCQTWSVIGAETVPEKPATTIVLDPKSPVDSRTLYAGILGRGVYKSTDDGKTWDNSSEGLGTPENMNVWRLDLASDGTLLCGVSIAYKDEKPIPGALYRSRDGAKTWEMVNASQPMPYIWGVKMDPRDSNVIFVSCFDVPPPDYAAMGTGVPWPESTGGGVWKSTDDGRTWRKVIDADYAWDVTFDPNNPDVMYAGTFVDGVLRSADGGETWARLEGLPFICAHRAKVDPADSNVIYVTTFGGGVWKGTLE